MRSRIRIEGRTLAESRDTTRAFTDPDVYLHRSLLHPEMFRVRINFPSRDKTRPNQET